ncbi:MAG: tRNA-dihydrouridine synthase family protein [Pseudomonadota bacterium]
MKILLAPMEGVVDPVLRQLITQMGGVDYCVTEFVRITSHLYPEKVFHKYCPELFTNSRTLAGTPVFVQILGSDLTTMAENAHKVAEMGAYGIDINFGCPAKTVNRHDGGAALLKDPERVFQVTQAVRKAVPQDKPVTVKVRLGFSDKSFSNDIALAAEAGGGHWLTVHARTKEEGYRPPAHWEYIAPMNELIQIPVIANGDIWTPEDHKKCQQVSGCRDTMLGRGLVARPSLALEIKKQQRLKLFSELKDFVIRFVELSEEHRNDQYAVQRTKQLTKLMGRTYQEATELFDSIKRLRELPDVKSQIHSFFERSPALEHSIES